MLNYTNGHRRAITGASLAQLRRHMSASARACLAADVIDGRVVLRGLTNKAVAALVGVNTAYVDRALQLTPEQRAEVCRGARPLAKAPKRKSAQPFDWDSVSDDDLVEAVRKIGLDRALHDTRRWRRSSPAPPCPRSPTRCQPNPHPDARCSSRDFARCPMSIRSDRCA